MEKIDCTIFQKVKSLKIDNFHQFPSIFNSRWFHSLNPSIMQKLKWNHFHFRSIWWVYFSIIFLASAFHFSILHPFFPLCSLYRVLKVDLFLLAHMISYSLQHGKSVERNHRKYSSSRKNWAKLNWEKTNWISRNWQRNGNSNSFANQLTSFFALLDTFSRALSCDMLIGFQFKHLLTFSHFFHVINSFLV